MNQIHIIGLPRSGTTIFYRMLAKHKTLAWFHHHINPGFLCRSLRSLDKIKPIEGNPWNKFYNEFEHITKEKLNQVNKQRDYYLMEFKKTCNEFQTNTFLSKWPGNSLKINWLWSMFPESYFILLHRDRDATIESLYENCNYNLARDVVGTVIYPNGFKGWVSILNKFGNGTLTMETITKYYDYMKEIQIEDSKDIANIIHISYEDFVANPQKEIDKVCDFTGLETIDLELPLLRNMNYRHRKQ